MRKMKTAHLIPSTVLAVLFSTAVLPGAAPRRDRLVFAPEEGLSVSRQLQIEASFDLEDVWANVDGAELPAEMVMDQVDEGILVQADIEVSDELLRSEGGRYHELIRNYDAIEIEAGMPSEMESIEEADFLVDQAIRFSWNEEEESYDLSFAEEGADEELLEGLDADMDCLAVLPAGEVSAGDRWEVTGDDLGPLFLPGGLGGSSEEESGDEVLDLAFETIEEQIESFFSELSVQCEYKGIQRQDDVEVGVIAVSYDDSTSIDLSDFLGEVFAQQEIPGEIDVSLLLDLEFAGEGSLLWNLEAGHVHDFDMQAEVTMTLEAEADADVDGESHSAEGTAEIYGEIEWSLTAR